MRKCIPAVPSRTELRVPFLAYTRLVSKAMPSGKFDSTVSASLPFFFLLGDEGWYIKYQFMHCVQY